jgi:hypothetical protein
MWSDRLSGAAYRVMVAALFAGLVWFAFRAARAPGELSLGREECARSYRLARTAADTAIIDLRHPAMGTARAPTPPTCGVLRRLHRLP